MPLQEQNLVDKIEIFPDTGTVGIRSIARIIRPTGEVVAETFHREVVHPYDIDADSKLTTKLGANAAEIKAIINRIPAEKKQRPVNPV